MDVGHRVGRHQIIAPNCTDVVKQACIEARVSIKLVSLKRLKKRFDIQFLLSRQGKLSQYIWSHFT